MHDPGRLSWRVLRAAALALILAAGQVVPAWATIDNTVTVTGSSPSGTNDVTDNDTENVDVVDSAPALTVTKVADDDTDVTVGQLITYTYTITNSGNVTMTDITLADVHDGTGPAPVPNPDTATLTDNGTAGDSTNPTTGDNDWDTLAPLDVLTMTATYTITQADVTSNGGGDNDLDNVATATGNYGGSPTSSPPLAYSIDLEDIAATLTVAKTADDTTDVTLGQLITYTYVITNTGNVPITAISLSDVHNGSGPAPTPDADSATLTDNLPAGDSTNPTGGDNEWDTLAPGDVLTVTATYTVTQSDIDTLQ
ncbi:MAG: hypothetical protein AB3N20_14900 [Rhizobiaceae bacterium]